MKIAFPTNENSISDHFGHCDHFTVYEIDSDKKIINQTTIAAPSEHQPGVLPNLLAEYGINVVIAGGIGQKAITLFNAKNIQVITGASGAIDAALTQFLDGNLQDGNNICSH